jgi:flagellar biosynthesis protein
MKDSTNMNDSDKLVHEASRAIAIFYDGKNAPTISAKGMGDDAEEIIRIAREAGVPLCDNAPLVGLLSQLEPGESIPEQLYLAIAHIIAFAYKLELDSGSA